MNGVTTCLDMAGPLENILDNVPKYGVGINMATSSSPLLPSPSRMPTLPSRK